MDLSAELIRKRRYKIFFRIFYVIIIILLIWGFYYFNYLKNTWEEKQFKKTEFVTRWNISTYISWEWKIISWKKVELNFPISWEIKKIYKKEWEDMLVWEKIAELDNKSLKLNLDKANIALKNSYAVLEEKKELTDNSKNIYTKNLDLAIINLNNTTLKSNIDLENAKDNYNLLKVKKDNLMLKKEIEESNLALIEQDENKKIENLKYIYELKVNIIFLVLDKYLWEVYDLLMKNNNNENYLWAKNTNVKNEARNSYEELNNLFKNDKNSSNVLDYSEKLKSLLGLTILVLENSIESFNILTNDEIKSKKTVFQWFLSSFELDYQNYLLAKQSYDYEVISKEILLNKQNNIIKSLSWDIDLMSKDLEVAYKNIENIKNLSESNVILTTKQKEKSEVEYLDNISWLSDKKLKPYMIAIEDAQNKVEEAKQNLNKTILYSSVNWNILYINYKAWEYYNMQKPLLTVTSLNGQYIESYMEEKDIVDIFKWQDVNINFDAIEWSSFTWQVIYISDKWEKDDHGIIVYKTLVSFDIRVKNIKDSMSVNLDFLKDRVVNDIVIPVDYVYYENGIWKVMLSNWEVREVKEWISDGEKVQILEGLKEGDEIVIK